MDVLQKIVEIFEERDLQIVRLSTVLKAVVASKQGNYDQARELIHKTSGPFEFFGLRSAYTFLHTSYVSTSIELTAGKYDRTASHFTTTIEGCDMQGDLLFKAFSQCGLGEIAGKLALAAERFTQTRSLCTEMGVIPRNLYRCVPFDVLPNRFFGIVVIFGGSVTFCKCYVDYLFTVPVTCRMYICTVWISSVLLSDTTYL